MDPHVQRWFDTYTAETGRRPSDATQLVTFVKNRGSRVSYSEAKGFLDAFARRSASRENATLPTSVDRDRTGARDAMHSGADRAHSSSGNATSLEAQVEWLRRELARERLSKEELRNELLTVRCEVLRLQAQLDDQSDMRKLFEEGASKRAQLEALMEIGEAREEQAKERERAMQQLSPQLPEILVFAETILK